jgi:hypothetical protein
MRQRLNRRTVDALELAWELALRVTTAFVLLALALGAGWVVFELSDLILAR